MKQWRTRAALLAIMAAFIAAGMLFVPRLGIEADEAVITAGIYDHADPWYSWHIGANEIPVMMMSYVGALKTWLYNLLFVFFRPSVTSIRLPMLIIAAITIVLFFQLLDQAVGRRAAWIGTALLATDTSYLLLTIPDFGPVTLQFLFKLSAMLLLLRFYRSGSERALAGGFFLLGLALWDKAVFLWVLFGLGVAVLAVFPREVLKRLTLRSAGIALAAAVIGALPLIIYNVKHPLETLTANAHVQPESALAKAEVVKITMDGSVLFGFLTADSPGPNPLPARHWFQSLSISVSRWTGHPHSNLILIALALSVIALGFLWRTSARRPMLFGLITCVATWVPMALTANAGAAAQHTVLLWPFHLMVIATALAAAPLGIAVTCAVVLCGTNLALTNQYYADLLRNGPALRWTDAMDELKQYLGDSKSPRIYIADWGIGETLDLLSEGEMPVYFADLRSEQDMDAMIKWPRSVFVAHPSAVEFTPQIREQIDQRAAQDGYQEELVTTISDRNGRPTFEVFRFRKIHL